MWVRGHCVVRLPDPTDTGPAGPATAGPAGRVARYAGGVTTLLVHEPDASRYALYIDGELAALADYVVRGDTVSFHHTFTQPNHRGQGLAGQVVEFAMNDVEATSIRAVSPDCWYVHNWFTTHPERANLLRVRR